MKKSDNLAQRLIDESFEYMPDVFISRLEDVLKDKGIKPKTFSREMGCSINTAYEWIYAARIPKVTNYFKICKYLDVNPLYLWGLTEEKGHYKQ